MQIVIDIPESIYEEVMSGDWSNFTPYGFCKAIENGIRLPKGHGRLIDADALDRRNVNCANVPMNFVDVAPTIIEADKESENKE